MKTSKLRMFGKLYMKDIQDIKMESFIFLIAVAAWNIFLYLKYLSNWPYQVSIGLSTIAFGIAAFVPFIESFKLLRDEWKNNTVYLVMSLPVSGSLILLSKLTVILTQYVVFSLFSVACFVLLTYATPAWGFTWEVIRNTIADQTLPFKFASAFYITTVVGMLYTTALAFLSSVVGKSVRKFSFLTTVGTFLLGGYVFSKVTNSIAMGLEKIGISGLFYSRPTDLQGIVVEGFPAAPVIASLTIGTIIFVLAVRIYESVVEL